MSFSCFLSFLFNYLSFLFLQRKLRINAYIDGLLRHRLDFDNIVVFKHAAIWFLLFQWTYLSLCLFFLFISFRTIWFCIRFFVWSWGLKLLLVWSFGLRLFWWNVVWLNFNVHVFKDRYHFVVKLDVWLLKLNCRRSRNRNCCWLMLLLLWCNLQKLRSFLWCFWSQSLILLRRWSFGTFTKVSYWL